LYFYVNWQQTAFGKLVKLNTLATHPQLLPAFIALIVCLILFDTMVLRAQGDAVPTFKKAVLWSGFWIGLALLFCGFLGLYLSHEHAVLFLTGYVVEMSLSVDNLFVFILIFTSFKVPAQYQHRVLFWGVVGALVMRAICIWAGVAALQRFEWLEFVFALILLWAGYKTLKESFHHEDDAGLDDPSHSKLSQWLQKVIPFTSVIESSRFFVREQGRLKATPLLLVLIMVELSDVIFAVDSIPAVLAVSRDEFIVYSSNIFAILGLRNLYFVLSEMMHKFPYLDRGVSCILIFVGLKMAISHYYPIAAVQALLVILIILTASMVWPKKA
jgi:tellurite resistance protein TerC